MLTEPRLLDAASRAMTDAELRLADHPLDVVGEILNVWFPRPGLLNVVLVGVLLECLVSLIIESAVQACIAVQSVRFLDLWPSADSAELQTEAASNGLCNLPHVTFLWFR